MSFQGDISSLPLCDVLQNLAANQKTGTLVIFSGNFEGRIQFEKGSVLSYADKAGFSIHQWLVDKEIVPADRMQEAIKRYRRSKRKTLGEILRDLKVIDLETYGEYVTHLVWEAICEVLSLEEGTFEFREGQAEPGFVRREAERLGLQFSPSSLIMEAARRSDDWKNIRRHIPSENEIYWISPSEREHLLEKTEDEITPLTLELLDGTRTLRQVIADLPYSRFDACRCLADLIASKKVKPLDSTKAVEQTSINENPLHATACLRAIHEREPNNRDVLERLASLHESQGQPEESARFTKLLAVSFLEEGDLERARTHLRKSLDLNPKDIITWQKLWDCVRQGGVKDEIYRLGKQYVQHFGKMGLTEMVRERLLELVELFPESRSFKIELAEARFALGEHKLAVQSMMDLGRKLIGKLEYDAAESVFRQVLKFDHQHEKAREYCDQINSGRLEQKRLFWRRVRRGALAASVLALAGLVVWREVVAQHRFLAFTREAFAESLLEEGRYDEAMARVRKIQKENPLTISALVEGRALLEILERKQEGSTDGPAPSGDSTSPAGEASATSATSATGPSPSDPPSASSEWK